jgi:pimeloyl-ACP methyl ester carboxylesterase
MRLAAFPLLGPALTPPFMWLGVRLGPRLFPEKFGRIEPEEAQLLVRMHRIRGTAQAFRRSLAGVINLSGQYVQTLERAHEIRSPPAIALFWGAEDPVIPVRHGTRLLERFMGITLTAYPGCGHLPQLDVHSPVIVSRVHQSDGDLHHLADAEAVGSDLSSEHPCRLS